jgi:two-component system nitrate/nitrite response regulator NarL
MRLLIADDHKLLRDTLSAFLELESDIEIVTAGDMSEVALILAASAPFDLLLLDYGIPGMNSLEDLSLILNKPDAPPIALISTMAQRTMVERALAIGVRGFLHKSMTAASLLNAVRFMVLGERYVPVDFLTEPDSPTEAESSFPPYKSKRPQLTSRESEVLQALCAGKTNKEIARDLSLSEPTIKLHVKTLCRRLGVNNRTQAVRAALTYGLP